MKSWILFWKLIVRNSWRINLLPSFRNFVRFSFEDLFQERVMFQRHKIFLIRGELPKLKEALEKRGWVQKYEATKTRNLPYG